MPARFWFVMIVATAATITSLPAQAASAADVASFLSRRTIRTPLPVPKNPVPPFVDPGIAHVVLIVLENCGQDEAAQQPFMRARAREGTVLDHYFAVAHPSQPNYIALISGNTAGTRGDRTPTLHRTHLGDRLPHRWKAYVEDYPAPSDPRLCSPVSRDGAYVRRHVPFLSFAGVDCRAIVRLNADATTRRVSSATPPPRDVASVTKALRDDIANATLPAFTLIVPNLEDDGHEPSNVHNANEWLTRYFSPLLDDPKFVKDTVFFLTFDEDEHQTARDPNRVYTVVWGDHVLHGTNDNVYDHEDLFLTIAALLHVSPLPVTGEKHSRPISGIWR